MGSASPAPPGEGSRGKEGSGGDGRNIDSADESTDTEETVRRRAAAANALLRAGSGCSPAAPSAFPFADEGPHLGSRGEPVVGMPEPRSSCPISVSAWRLPAGARPVPSAPPCTHVPTTSASSPVPRVGQPW